MKKKVELDGVSYQIETSDSGSAIHIYVDGEHCHLFRPGKNETTLDQLKIEIIKAIKEFNLRKKRKLEIKDWDGKL